MDEAKPAGQTVPLEPLVGLGCDYQGHEFGSEHYPDSVCIDGYLWDADSCDEPGGGLRHGGELRCPQCNRIEVADVVHHEPPPGEDWVAARVTERHVYPAGWPPCRADLEDCTLLKKATAQQREEMLAQLAQLPPTDERHVKPNA